MKINLIQISKIAWYKRPEVFMSVYRQLENLNYEYPDFYKWFFLKVVPQQLLGQREIIIAHHEKNIAGISILKNSSEKKICTLRVHKSYQRNGIARKLFENSFDILQTDKPIITVPSRRINEFEKILRYYNFRLQEIYPDYYKNNSNEYAFNGILDTKLAYSKHSSEMILLQ